MIRNILRCLRALVWLTLACASLPAVAGQPGGDARLAGDEARQILVMLPIAPDHFRPNASYGGGYGDGVGSRARRRLAAGIARRHGLGLTDQGWPMPLLGVDCFVMRVPVGMTVEAAVQAVSADPAVAWSEPMQIYRAQGGTGRAGDPLLPLQPAETIWHLEDLHRIATGRGVIVAVIDSKIETGHPDLAGQFVADQDFVGGSTRPERHGTAVAGVIAAKAGNGLGIAGVAPAARLMALRACRQAGEEASAPTLCTSLGLAQALQYAILHGARVINLSLAGPADRLLDRLIDAAENRNITIVAAYDASMLNGGFPASKAGVIAVGNESLSPPPQGVYAAPGRDVPTTQAGGKWSLVDGSSFAAAHVSGLIALVRQEPTSPARPSLAVTSRTGLVDACTTLLRTRHCDCSCPRGSGSMAH